MGRTFTPEQIAKDWQVSRRTVLRLIQEGALPAFVVRGGKRPRYRITAEAIDAYQASAAAVTPPPARPKPRRSERPGFIEFV